MASQITANIIKNGEPVDILYGRLSQEDDHAGDSNSIVNQRSYLEKYAATTDSRIPYSWRTMVTAVPTLTVPRGRIS